MNTLLNSIVETHGGLARWKSYQTVEATIVSGGGFFALKGMPRDATPRRVCARLHQQRLTIGAFGASDQRAVFTPDEVRIEKLDGAPIARRRAPKESFAGHQMNTSWDPLHLAYFSGEALWTYLTTPFILTLDGVETEEVDPWTEAHETWRCLRAYFPASIETHSQVQEFYFGEDLKLRRHDYRVNIAGGFAAAQLTGDYVEAEGIRLPTRRRAHTRGSDGSPVREMLMVYIDVSDVRFK